MKKDLIRQLFFQRMGEFPEHIIAAPGRINLIGEHTDYNGGHVLPATIDRYVYVAISKSDDSDVIAEAIDLQERYEGTVDNMEDVESHWEICLRGAVRLLRPLGDVTGFALVIMSDLPMGSGLSSSSAMVCGMLASLSTCFDLNMDRKTISELARKIEIEDAGIDCGYMDQFIICHGRANQAALLNCKTLDTSWIDIAFPEHRLLLINSNAPRSLHDSAYNDRKQTCDSIVRHFNEFGGNYEFLCDIQPDELDSEKENLTVEQLDKGHFVLEENQRVLEFVQHLRQNDYSEMGRLLYASHRGLKDLYEVSCPEIDFIIEGCKEIEPIKGARMIGGGFGGCVLCLVENQFEPELLEELLEKYHEEFDIEFELIDFKISDGLIY